MNQYDIFQIFITLGVIVFLAPILGGWMYRVLENKPHFCKKMFGILESLISKALGRKYEEEMTWKSYLSALLIFNFLGFISVFLMQVLQSLLPLNPENLPNVSWHSAFNTAVSFMTNTNWQGYAGETTLSYFVQMIGLTTQNFVSAATGIAVIAALGRGLARRNSQALGNFWADLTRSSLYILLPLCLVLSLLLVNEGVIQNFSSYIKVQTLEGSEQILPQGPAASQIAIKQLGTNGGGFFNANSAHPYENPTPFSNWLQLISILLLPAGLVFTFGKLIQNIRQGKIIFAAMMILLCLGLGLSLYSEYTSFPEFHKSVLMEGKETRFGVTNSILWSVFTTAASNGSVNSMHSSLSPLSGGIAMFNMMLGEIIFGGVGAGLYGMMLFILLTVFIAGLMVGRTPEYLGKKIETFEIKMVILAILLPNAAILIGAGIAAVAPAALASLSHKGPHGLSEILYAFTSAGGNNGSAFAGLSANTVFYNIMLGFVMLIGRFGVLIPVLAIAGSLAQKKYSPPSLGTFHTESLVFLVLLLSVILVVGGLTFFPALSLGPIVEHLLMKSGITF